MKEKKNKIKEYQEEYKTISNVHKIIIQEIIKELIKAKMINSVEEGFLYTYNKYLEVDKNSEKLKEKIIKVINEKKLNNYKNELSKIPEKDRNTILNISQKLLNIINEEKKKQKKDLVKPEDIFIFVYDKYLENNMELSKLQSEIERMIKEIEVKKVKHKEEENSNYSFEQQFQPNLK